MRLLDHIDDVEGDNNVESSLISLWNSYWIRLVFDEGN